MSTSNDSPTFVQGQCPSCLDEQGLFLLQCNHAGYCQGCHAEALRNLQEGELQPECPTCYETISLQTLRPILSPQFYATMHTRMLEWTTPANERLYCSNTQCLEFVPPSAPTCPRGRQCDCGTVTCLACKNNAHDGACPEDEGLKAAIETGQNGGGVFCPQCGQLIQRNLGCQHIYGNHMGCSFEFCFLCRAAWDDCLGSCPGSYEDAERRLNEVDPVQEALDAAEDEAIEAEERLAFTRLSTEFSDRDLFRRGELLDILNVTLIVHADYLARIPFANVLIRLGEHLLQHVLDGRDIHLDDPDQYQGIAWQIMQARDHVPVILFQPNGNDYIETRENLEILFQSLRQIRSDNFNAAAQEAIEMLNLYADHDLVEIRRFYENVLMSLTR